MNALTLQWQDAGQEKTENIYDKSPSKNPGTIRIGRDPLRCDIVLSNPTVSGLHVEVYFDSQQQSFFMRNLREQNPPLIDGQQLVKGEKPLTEGSIIFLGQQQLRVTAIVIPQASSIPATILSPPQPQVANYQPAIPPLQYQPQLQQRHIQHQSTPPEQQGAYGLECPKCQKISSPQHLQIGCPWCGTSLAAAVSVLVPPHRNS
jgi:predicted component of type VI protein secretion system